MLNMIGFQPNGVTPLPSKMNFSPASPQTMAFAATANNNRLMADTFTFTPSASLVRSGASTITAVGAGGPEDDKPKMATADQAAQLHRMYGTQPRVYLKVVEDTDADTDDDDVIAEPIPDPYINEDDE